MFKKLARAYHAEKTLSIVAAMLGRQNLTLIDIGAAGGVEPRWKQIGSLLNYIGFEPDARSNDDPSSVTKPFACYSIVPSAVWNREGRLSINLCQKPQVSSHFLPDAAMLKKFPKLDRFNVVKQVEVNCSRLDALNFRDGDFIKLDIQGGELAALQGAEGLLASTFGLEIEVEFVQIYQDQPLFGEICHFLGGHGFEFIDFTNLCRWDRRVRNGFGQCVFGDALFLKSPERMRKQFDAGAIALPELRRYLAILALYRRADLLQVCAGIFHDIFSMEQGFARQLDIVIGRLDGELGRMRFLSKAASWLLQLLGSQARFHIHY